VTTDSPVLLHHVLDDPEGAPVVVLSNSPGTTLRVWDDQAHALQSRFRCCATITADTVVRPSLPDRTRSTTLGGTY
jgi:hypothetical protein